MPNLIQKEISHPFRPRARWLQLSGDELIGKARLAIFELVKNAYDADANRVVVRLSLDATKAQLVCDPKVDPVWR